MSKLNPASAPLAPIPPLEKGRSVPLPNPPPLAGEGREGGRVGIVSDMTPTRSASRTDLPLAGGGRGLVARLCRNASRFIDARLHAVSSRNMYSEHGFEPRIGPEAGQVCQSLTVVWNCSPGSAEAHAA